jgi:hypothetical protein
MKIVGIFGGIALVWLILVAVLHVNHTSLGVDPMSMPILYLASRWRLFLRTAIASFVTGGLVIGITFCLCKQLSWLRRRSPLNIAMCASLCFTIISPLVILNATSGTSLPSAAPTKAPTSLPSAAPTKAPTSLLRPDAWTEEEDEMIIASIQKGILKWSEIGKATLPACF